MTNKNVTVRLATDDSRLAAGFARGKREVQSFASAVKSIAATLGVGMMTKKVLADSAQLSREQQKLQVAVGGSRQEMDAWRSEMMANQAATSTLVEGQLELSKALQAAGLGMDEIRATLKPASETMAVAEANAKSLGQALGVAREQFDIDLKNPEAVRTALDRMVVAGRLGNAELENLPDIFARVGGGAKAANLGFSETLALVESLSRAEANPERLATLADSTLRVFTNGRYMAEAQKATGVKFFDAKGGRRDALAVLRDLKKEYDKMKTDAQRHSFLQAAFGKADLDTLKGLRNLMDKGSLDQVGQMLSEIEGASGTVARDLDTAIANSVDQTNRLTAALRKSVDEGFAKPLNETYAGVLKWMMDENREAGGLGMNGDDMLAAAAVLTGGGALAARYGGKVLGPLFSKLGSLGTGVATGKVLQEAAGITPVFVTNWPAVGVGAGAPVPSVPGTPSNQPKGNPLKGKGSASALLLNPYTAAAGFAITLGVIGSKINEQDRAETQGRMRSARFGMGRNPAADRNSPQGPSIGKATIDGATKLLQATGQAQQSVIQAATAKISQTKIEGKVQVGVSVSAPAGLGVSTTASATGNGNTQVSANVGKTMQGG